MDLLITNARLIDCTGAPPRTPCSIRIRAGRIIEIERDPEKVREFGGLRINLDALIDWFIGRTKPRECAPWIELRRFALEDLR